MKKAPLNGRFALYLRPKNSAMRWAGLVCVASLALATIPRPATGSEADKDVSPKTGKDIPTVPAGNSLADEAADPAVDETFLLEVRVNGQPTGKIGEFTLRRGILMARPAELRDLGFRVPNTLAISADGLVALGSVPGLTWIVDVKNLELNVIANTNSMLPTVLQPVTRELAGDHRVIESGTGITLNYDTVGTFSSGNRSGTGSLDLRAFSPWGIASSGWLAYAGSSPTGSGSNVAVRLDSAYSFADINSLRATVWEISSTALWRGHAQFIWRACRSDQTSACARILSRSPCPRLQARRQCHPR